VQELTAGRVLAATSTFGNAASGIARIFAVFLR
jgi:hypothetical protein